MNWWATQHCTTAVPSSPFRLVMLLSQYFNNTTLQCTSLSKIRIFITSLAAPSLLHPPGEASKSRELVLLLLVHNLQLRCCWTEVLCTDEVTVTGECKMHALSAMSISHFSFVEIWRKRRSDPIFRKVKYMWFRHGWEQPQCSELRTGCSFCSWRLKSESYSRGREAQRLLRALRRR